MLTLFFYVLKLYLHVMKIHIVVLLLIICSAYAVRLDCRATGLFPIEPSAVTEAKNSLKIRSEQSMIHQPFLPLKVICEVNGHTIPAIIDTGAQVSIISMACAKRCGLMSHIDTRYQGKAIGVGSSDIIGRVNDLAIRLGPISFSSRVSVLDKSGIDFLIGLDFLRKFHAEVNLKDNVLRLQVQNRNIRIPFVLDSSGIDAIDYSAHNEVEQCFDNQEINRSEDIDTKQHDSASMSNHKVATSHRLFGKPFVRHNKQIEANGYSHHTAPQGAVNQDTQFNHKNNGSPQINADHGQHMKRDGLHRDQDRYANLQPRHKVEKEDDSMLSMEGV